jgi:hypothetical protein
MGLNRAFTLIQSILAFLARVGGDAACAILISYVVQREKPPARAFPTPALRKEREGLIG